MSGAKAIYLATERVETLIRVIRGQRVILDSDLARIYGVTTARLNQQVKRNQERFPDDFVFQLTQEERDSLMLQIATSKKGRGGVRKLPYAFTEHGAIMAANVLNSSRAARMSVFVVRAFVKMREVLAENKGLAEKLAELERNLTERLDLHEGVISKILGELRQLMNTTPQPEAPRRQIGFRVSEGRVTYRVRRNRQPLTTP